jgi:hypothetical protein
VACFVGDETSGRSGVSQINDVYVDENGILYAVEREAGGIHIMELDI